MYDELNELSQLSLEPISPRECSTERNNIIIISFNVTITILIIVITIQYMIHNDTRLICSSAAGGRQPAPDPDASGSRGGHAASPRQHAGHGEAIETWHTTKGSGEFTLLWTEPSILWR